MESASSSGLLERLTLKIESACSYRATSLLSLPSLLKHYLENVHIIALDGAIMWFLVCYFQVFLMSTINLQCVDECNNILQKWTNKIIRACCCLLLVSVSFCFHIALCHFNVFSSLSFHCLFQLLVYVSHTKHVTIW